MEADQFIKCDYNINDSSPLIGKNVRGINTDIYKRNRKTLKEKIMSFYYKEFDKITKKYTRGNAYQLQQISLLYNKQVQELISSHSNQNVPDQLYQLISYIRIEPLISDLINLNNAGSEFKIANLSKYIALTFFLFFSLLFVVHIIVRLVVYVIEVEEDTAEVHFKALHQKNDSKFSFLGGGKKILSVHMLQENVNIVFDTVASFYYQFILFVFFIPSTQIFSEIYNDQISGFGFTLASISFLNMILHLIIVIIYVLHDYDYEISYSDNLSKRDSLWGLFHIVSVGTMAAFYNTSWGLGISTIHWALKGFEMIELFIEFPYYDELIRRWNCIYLFCHFSFSFIAYLFMTMSLKGNCNISMIYLIIIPLACQIGDFVFFQMEKRVKENYKYSKNPSHIDLYVRFLNNLYDLDYNKYTQIKYGVDFESIYTDHITQCSDFKCFCSEYQYKPFKWENFIQSDDRSYFLQNYIVKLLESQTILVQNKKNHAANRLRFTYLQFLIEKVPNPTKGFTQIIHNLQDKGLITLKEQYVLHTIMRRCQKSYRSFFIESQYQNQRLPMMTVISFDHLLEASINLFKDVLYEARQFYNFLCQDVINLDHLYSFGRKIVKKRNMLEQNVKLLFDINPKSDILYGLAEGYTLLLDLKSRRVKQFKKKSLDLLNRGRLKQDIEISLTSKNSCIIYISLQSEGTIKKLTHSFQSIFGIPVKGIVGKSVDTIMPDVFRINLFRFSYFIQTFPYYTLGENHEKYISKFLEKGTMENMNKSRTNLFGKNALGFIFPIHLRIRLNYIGYEDFGVCGQISKVQDSPFQYITLDKDLNISDLTRNFYKQTFENAFDDEKNLCKKINLTRILPLMGSYIEENNFNKEHLIESTLMVIPASNRQISFFKKRTTNKKDTIQKYLKELNPNRFTYFEVTVQLMIVKSSYSDIYKIIEIKKMRKIKKLYQKQQLINEFVDQYNQTYGTQLFYTEPNNNSSRYLDTGTVIDQSQLNNSSVSGSSIMHSIKKKKTSKRESLQFKPNGEVVQQNFSKQKTLGISTAQINKLITSPLRFETLIGVHRLIKKFIKNMYQVINKRRNSSQKNGFVNSNDFNGSGNHQEKYSNADISEFPNQNQKISYSEIMAIDTPQSQSYSQSFKNSKTQQRVFINRDNFSGSPSSIQLQKVPSTAPSIQLKKEPSMNGKSLVHKKSSFLLKSHQQLDIQQEYLNDKFDGNSSINNLNEVLSGRSTQKPILSDIHDQSDNHRYFPPLASPSPSDILLNNNHNNMSNTVGYNFEFSNRYDYSSNQYDQQQLNHIDQYFSSDQPNDYQRNEGKDSNYSSQIQNNEDQENICPSTKYPSSMQISNKKINFQGRERPSLVIQNSKFYSRDFSQANNQDDITGLYSPHVKSDIHLIQDNVCLKIKQIYSDLISLCKKQQQKFFDQTSSEFNKQQTISLIETLSPQKQGKYNLKKYTTNYLQQVKESQLENSGNQGQNRQSLGDEFENQYNEDDEDRSTSRRRKKINTETIFAAENSKKQKEINDQQSVNSAMSQTYSKKLQVIESITSNDKPLLIVSIQLAGIVAFLFMVTVTSGIFIYLNTIFKENVNDFKNLLVGPQLQSDYAYLLKEREKLDSLSQSKSLIEKNQKSILESFKEDMILLFEEREGTDFSVRVNNEKISVDYYLLPNKINPLAYDTLNYPMKFTINYSVMILYTHMTLLIIPDKQFPNSIRYVQKNMIEYFKEFSNIQTITQSQSLQEVNNMELNIIITISIMEGVAFLVLIIGIPIYSKIQSSRESWLKLFATWPQVHHQILNAFNQYFHKIKFQFIMGLEIYIYP